MCAVHFSDFEGILEYIEPRTIAEACSLLTQYRAKTKEIGSKFMQNVKEKIEAKAA